MKIPFKLRLLLWFINRSKGPKIYEMTPARARSSSQKLVEKVGRHLDYPSIELSKVFDKDIPGRECKIPVRIYQARPDRNQPLIMFFHGGGFVMRSVDSHDKVCRRIARDNNAVVISVEYRLAPEYKFPAAVHDCYDATLWAANNQESHNGNVTKIVVMGDSAGGCLSAAVCLMSRDLDGPKINYQVLIYPCTDGTLSCASIDKYGKDYFLTKKMMEWFVNHYKSKEEDLYSPYLSMLLAKDLTNLPPAFIFTAEYDPLRDEGRKYAERLKEAGNEVIYKDYGGMIHGFFNMPKMSRHVLKAHNDIKEVLSDVFST